MTYRIDLETLWCGETQGSGSEDEARLEVYVDSVRQLPLSRKMDERETWRLQKSYVFEDRVVVVLWEEDRGEDDLVGRKVFGKIPRNHQTEIFDQAGGRYRLRYSITEIQDISEQATTDICAMTINVKVDEDDEPNRWRDRRNRIRTLINKYWHSKHLAVIGMQEITPPVFGNLKQDLGSSSRFTYHGYFQMRGGRHGWGRNEGVAIFWWMERLEYLESGKFSMNPRERREIADCRPSGDLRDLKNRNCVWIRFRDRITSHTFYVYSAHFGGSSCEKLGCAMITARNISKRQFLDDPVILTGDFNFGLLENGTWDKRYVKLLQLTGLQNAIDVAGQSGVSFGTKNSEFKNKRTNEMIDHILVSPQVRTGSSGVDRTMFKAHNRPVSCAKIKADGKCEGTDEMASELRMYSDHWAVWANLGFPER